MAKKIVGITRSEGKNGAINSNIYYTEPFDSYAIEKQGATGIKCGVEFTNRVDTTQLKPGDEVEFYYGKGFQGMAVLEQIAVVKTNK